VVTLPTDHLSPSQVGMYSRCPESYRRRYVEGERIPPAVAMARGTGLHRAAEKRHIKRAAEDVEMPRADVVDVAVASYDDAVADGVTLAPDEAKRGADVVVGEGRDSTARLAGAFADLVAPTILKPTAVELKIKIAVPKLGVDLVGILDLAHEVDSAEHVEDLKTGKARRSQQQTDADVQLSWYAMAFRYLRGEYPASVGIRQILERAKGDDATLIRSTRGDDDTRRLLATIEATALAISAGIFPPAYEGAWWCSPAACGYWSTCRYRGGK